MKLLNRLTIYPKLVLTFMIILVPLVSISLLMNAKSERLVRKEITGSMQAKANSNINSLERDFGPLVTLQRQYVSDDDIVDLAYSTIIMSNEQYTQAVKNVQKKLLILKFMSSYVSDAFVNFPALDRKVSASSFDMISQDEENALNQIVNSYESPFLLYDGNLWLSMPYPSMKPVGQGFTIAMKISDAAIRQSLLDYQINGHGGAVLLSEHFDWHVSGGDVPEDLASTTKLLRERFDQGTSSGYGTISTATGDYYAFFEKSSRLGLTLVFFIDESSFIGPIKQYGMWVWWLALASLLVILVFAYHLYRTIHHPLKELVKAFKSLEKGDLAFKLRFRSKDEFNYLYLQFNRTVSRLEELINEVYVQRYQVKTAELKQLQSQINPHFLYNSLFNLYRLAKMREIDKVIPFTKHLGDYFKYVTKTSDSVPLEQEVMFCRAYVAIQTIRFETHIRVDFDDIPERLADLQVPKLFLQPLVENCYVHSLEDRVEPGYICVSFDDREGFAEIVVEDDGDRLSEDELFRLRRLLAEPEVESESEGLRNVQQRLRLNFGGEAGLIAERSSLGGLRVAVRIPYAN